MLIARGKIPREDPFSGDTVIYHKRSKRLKITTIYLLAWIGLVFLAIVNGGLRTAGYARCMSDVSAHQLSTLIGLGLFALYLWILSLLFPISSARQALLIGGLWTLMAIAFEFLFGHFVMGHPWSKLFADYNLLKGRVWLLVLIWTFIGPYVFYKLRR